MFSLDLFHALSNSGPWRTHWMAEIYFMIRRRHLRSQKRFHMMSTMHTYRHLNSDGELSRWARKPQSSCWSWHNDSQSMVDIYYWCGGKNGKNRSTPRILMLKICDSLFLMWLLPQPKIGKNRRSVLNTYKISDRKFEDYWGCFGAWKVLSVWCIRKFE